MTTDARIGLDVVRRYDGAENMLELIAQLRVVKGDLACPDSCEQHDSPAFGIVDVGKVAIGFGHGSRSLIDLPDDHGGRGLSATAGADRVAPG